MKLDIELLLLSFVLSLFVNLGIYLIERNCKEYKKGVCNRSECKLWTCKYYHLKEGKNMRKEFNVSEESREVKSKRVNVNISLKVDEFFVGKAENMGLSKKALMSVVLDNYMCDCLALGIEEKSSINECEHGVGCGAYCPECL